MNCCDEVKNQRPYTAITPTGQAVCCKKCGRARAATKQEIERSVSQPNPDS